MEFEVYYFQLVCVRGMLCFVYGCDGKFFCDECGEEMFFCECGFCICCDCYLDVLVFFFFKCFGCKDDYKICDELFCFIIFCFLIIFLSMNFI